MDVLDKPHISKDRVKGEFSVINSPHDHLFRKMMHDPSVAASFLHQHLPKENLDCIDLTSLKVMPDHFIENNLRKSICDMLYQVKNKDQSGTIFILVEHQSTADQIMPLRIWSYLIQIKKKYLSLKMDKPIPLVMSLVFYNGNYSYSKPQSLIELINADPELVKFNLGELKQFNLIDVNDICDAEFKGRGWSGRWCNILSVN